MNLCPDCQRPLERNRIACARCGWQPEARKHELTQEQQDAYRIMDDGPTFLSGEAGTGKSFLLSRWITDHQQLRGKWGDIQEVAVTASTGLAASHLPGGRTLHSWCGMGTGEKPLSEITGKGYWWDRTVPRIRAAKYLVIDEVSLLSGAHFSLCSDLCKEARGDRRPFGGLHVIVCGDMGQLPPIGEGFVFETEEWWDANIRTVNLTQVHRTSDIVFSRILHDIRLGTLSDEGKSVLESRVRAFDPEALPEAARLTTHNALADDVNSRKLSSLPGTPVSYVAREASFDNYAREALERNLLTPRHLDLKVGARVMFTRNDPYGTYVNGTLARVTWMSTDTVEVETDAGRILLVPRVLWGVGYDDPRALENVLYRWDEGTKTVERRETPLPCRQGQAWREQFPFRLAWAITIHKSQGCTLDRVSVDLGDVFAPGQAYVALSRARSLEGLNIERWRGADSIMAHPTAMKFLRGEFSPPEEWLAMRMAQKLAGEIPGADFTPTGRPVLGIRKVSL